MARSNVVLPQPEGPRKQTNSPSPISSEMSPSAAFSRRSVTYAPFPGMPEETRTLGVVDRLFPDLSALVGCPQEPEWHPEGDVWVHTLMVIDTARVQSRDLDRPRRLAIMLAAAPLAAHVPLAALAAILVGVAINMGEWHAFTHLRARPVSANAIMPPHSATIGMPPAWTARMEAVQFAARDSCSACSSG